MGRDVIVTVLLIALAAVGSRAVFTRLEGPLPNVTLRAAIAGVLATFFLLHVVLPRGSDLVVFGLCLAYGRSSLASWPRVVCCSYLLNRRPCGRRRPAPAITAPRRGAGAA